MFEHFAEFAAKGIEGAAVVIVTYGCLEAFIQLVRVMVLRTDTHGERKAIWRRLGVFAVVRTFLNYFLEKDLDHAEEAHEPPATA